MHNSSVVAHTYLVVQLPRHTLVVLHGALVHHQDGHGQVNRVPAAGLGLPQQAPGKGCAGLPLELSHRQHLGLTLSCHLEVHSGGGKGRGLGEGSHVGAMHEAVVGSD